MSRLHGALSRASEGKVPILPGDAGIDAGGGLDVNQSAFSVPWTMESPAAEPAADASGPPGQEGAQAAARRGFLLTLSKHAASVPAGSEEKLVGVTGPEPGTGLALAVEQYRKLAAVLLHAQAERQLKLVMVTSANPGEGKSLTAQNLALTLSESYQSRVLLIDADLRRPSLHETLGAPNRSGLSDGLASDNVRTLPITEVTPRLSLLPSGPTIADPTAAMSSPQMRDLLDDARASYDWVIIDTPPVGLLSDAKLLGAMVDGVVLVIEAGVTSYQDAQRAIAAVGRERLVGAVLNRLRDIPGGAKYYRSYYYSRPHARGA